MTYYVADPNEKSKIEKKVINQLGNPEMAEKYMRAKKLMTIAPPVVISSAAISFLYGFYHFFNNSSLKGGIGMAAFILLVLSGFVIEGISHEYKRDSLSLSPDIKELSVSEKKERLEIDEHCITHTFLYKEGGEYETAVYHKRVMDTNTITEILRCDELGLYIFNGSLSSWEAKGDILKTDPEKVNWSVYSLDNHLNLRIYDYWFNNESESHDLRYVINDQYGDLIKNISKEEATGIIRREDVLKISGSQNRFLQ